MVVNLRLQCALEQMAVCWHDLFEVFGIVILMKHANACAEGQGGLDLTRRCYPQNIKISRGIHVSRQNVNQASATVGDGGVVGSSIQKSSEIKAPYVIPHLSTSLA